MHGLFLRFSGMKDFCRIRFGIMCMPGKKERSFRQPDKRDPEYRHGNRMNCSERKKYDELFPEHPLSQMRVLVKELAELN